MNDADLTARSHRLWLELSPAIRTRAVDHVRKECGDEVLAKIREAHAREPHTWWAAYHFGWGMSVRNALREVATDAQLPTGNWDDYYVQAVEHAAGVESST